MPGAELSTCRSMVNQGEAHQECVTDDGMPQGAASDAEDQAGTLGHRAEEEPATVPVAKPCSFYLRTGTCAVSTFSEHNAVYKTWGRAHPERAAKVRYIPPERFNLVPRSVCWPPSIQGDVGPPCLP